MGDNDMRRPSILLTLLLLIIATVPARAVVVDVAWDQAADPDRTKAVAKAIDQAVLVEALEILPGAITKPREILLQDFLSQRSDLFVHRQLHFRPS